MASHNLIKTLSEFAWIMLSMERLMYLAQLAPRWHKKFYTKVEETLPCKKYKHFHNVFSVAFLHPGRKLGPKVCWNKKMRKKELYAIHGICSLG
jgi:hypothetical protein